DYVTRPNYGSTRTYGLSNEQRHQRPPVSRHSTNRRQTRYDSHGYYVENDEVSGSIRSSSHYSNERNVAVPTAQVVVSHLTSPAPARRLAVRTATESTARTTVRDNVRDMAVLDGNVLLETTGTIDPVVASRLNEINIRTVADFLSASTTEVDSFLQQWGQAANVVKRWRDQLRLRCSVPGIGADDARLLVAAGVTTLDELADTNLDILCQRFGHLLSTQRTRDGRQYRDAIDSYPRSRMQNWIHSARQYRQRSSGRVYERNDLQPRPYADDVDFVIDEPNRWQDYPESNQYQSRERGTRRTSDGRAYNRVPREYDFDGYSNSSERSYDRESRTSRRSDSTTRSRSGSGGNGTGSGSGNGSGSGSGNGSGSGSGRGTGSGRSSGNRSSLGSTNRSSRSTRSSSTGSSSSSRSSNRSSRSRSSRSERSEREPREPRAERTRELRFYLDADDPVVDAPTIGPKTAERLHAVGIMTVKDLIEANADALAARINYKRITADDIRSWQQQSLMACRIPQIRGHDAQILVACGVTDPARLASMSANELWGIVQPFTKTAECKRIVRNGKYPDLDEIQDWITWASSARTMQVA
ncbi:MAG: DUF4332 domain-containing protein, partial [Planctomycetota bacterium]